MLLVSGSWSHTLQVSSSGSPYIITTIDNGRYFLTQSLIDMLCSIRMDSLFINLTVNLSTSIKPFFCSLSWMGRIGISDLV